ASVLFLAWIGWLLYLVLNTRHPIILSRPQFLVANLYVVAQVNGSAQEADGKASVLRVPWALTAADEKLKGTEITIRYLDEAGLPGWEGAGEYILPLVRDKDGGFRLALTPTSPGYSPGNPLDRLRIYSVTPQALAQLDEIVRGRKGP